MNLDLVFYSADKDATKGKKTARKTTRAGGSGLDLANIAQEQQIKLEKKREEIKEQIQAAKEEAAAAPPPSPPSPPIPTPPTPSPSHGPAPPAEAAPEEPKDTGKGADLITT